ncbi:LysM peptidoglycan-binding domain-containing protein [Saccharopolyspora sp. SCSIO 74807]|uniref:LysM peptidoglycan-binding domain-containing protein n=1 Tax=Saccharopolyspora sp. SCSIO 74807 TaxID=3118084 RepID=UPI0030CF57C9
MISTVLRRVAAVLGILLLVTVMPTVLVLCTRWFDWPELTWPPLQSGFLGEFSPTDFQAWLVATYHESRLSLGTEGLLLASGLLALWGTWLTMIWCLVADTAAVLRFGARRLREHGPHSVRGWVTALVTSTVLVGTAGPSLASTLPAHPVAASAPRHPSGPQRAPEPLRAAPEAGGHHDGPPASGPMLRTHRGDSLWELAKIHLGDGNRWGEITDLNPHLSPEPQFLRAGDWLRMPDDAVRIEPAPLPDGVRWITVTEGDTLSGLAQQHLGDPDRWGEIFDLNRGRTQDADRTLRRPGFLMPGWRLAIPPAHAETERSPAPAVPAPDIPQPPQQQPPSPDTANSTEAEGAVGPAITLPTGGLVAAGLAVAVALGMVLQRRRRRRTYLPGSGDRTPPPEPAPVVRHLRLAEDRAVVTGEEPDLAEPVTVHSDENDTTGAQPHAKAVSALAMEVGVGDGRSRALDLAALHGLGLTGAGAEATARALLVHLLGTTHAAVLIPQHDARALIGDDPPTSARLHITGDLDEALATLADRSDTDQRQDIALVASLDHVPQHLATALAPSGIAGILLGDHPTGATVRVRADGLVTATSPALNELNGTRMFHLNATDTRDLIDLLTDTDDTAEPTAVDHAVSPEPGNHDAPTAPAGNAQLPTLPDSTPINDEHDEPGSADQAPDTEPAPATDHPESSNRPLHLAVFGPPTLTWHTSHGTSHDLTTALAPKHKALLVFLALHPRGASREAMRDALWPDSRGSRPYNAFYAALSQLRKTVTDATDEGADDLVLHDDETVTLNPNLVTVDYWQFDQAEQDQRRAAPKQQRLDACSRIIALYRGHLAAGHSTLWLDAPREATHRTTIDAVTTLADHYRTSDPQRRLQLLEHARTLSPENEHLYRDIIRTQAQLGHTDAIPRTLHLLTHTLANIGERPEATTLTLARTLQTTPPTPTKTRQCDQ